VIVVGKGVFVERRFGLCLNRVLVQIEICRFTKDRILDDNYGQFRYRTDTDVLDGFYAFPL